MRSITEWFFSVPGAQLTWLEAMLLAVTLCDPSREGAEVQPGAPQQGLHCGHHGRSCEQMLGYVALTLTRVEAWTTDGFKPKTLEVPSSIKDKEGTCSQWCCPSLHPRPDLLVVYSGPQNKALLSPISLAHLSQADGPGKTLRVHLSPHTHLCELCLLPPSIIPCSLTAPNQTQPPPRSSTISFIDLEVVSQISREMSLGHR